MDSSLGFSTDIMDSYSGGSQQRRIERAPGIPREEWDQVKPFIYRYYLHERRRFNEVRDLMERRHQFKATEQQYRVKLREWRMFKNKKRSSVEMRVSSSEQETVFGEIDLSLTSSYVSIGDVGSISSLVPVSAPDEQHLTSLFSDELPPNMLPVDAFGINQIPSPLRFGPSSSQLNRNRRATSYLIQPMYNFAYYGSLSMFRQLLDHSPEYAYLPDEERVAPVCIAARQGHAELVRLLVDECKVSVNVTCKHFNNTTPLHHATAGGNIGIVRILLQNGANPDARGGDLNASPLCIAAHIRSYPIVKLLIENGADVNVADNGGLFPLHHAAHNGHMEMVSLLLKHGAKVDPHENNGKSPLWLAAQFEKTEIVRVLLENGANPETTDIKFARRPLHQAALGGHLEIASMLLKEKVEVDAVDGGGCTPLLLAAHKGHLELVKMLLEAEANVNLAENYGTNALWIAAQLGFTKIVKVLLSYNSFVSSAGPSKRYPIHQAAQNGHLEVVKLLVEYDPGCVNCQDEQGSTPLDISTMGNNPDNRAIMDYLCGFWCLT